MKMRLGSQQLGRMFRLVRLWFAGALLILSIMPSWALAQSSDDPWTEPVNLSRSGIAHNPSFVMDSDGVGHVIWQDDLAKYLYARFDGDQWSAPETTDLDRVFDLPLETETPIYTGPNPLFIAAPDQISGFWISPDDVLFRSKVKNADFKRPNGWESKIVMASGVASFAVTADAGGELHLAYFLTGAEDERPVGIYYTRSRTTGANWTAPVLLYDSPYLRTLVEGEGNLSIVTTGSQDALHVYVAWDNRPRKQVFLARSADGGLTWEEPKLVAGPAANAGLGGPFNIRVGANQKSVVLIWQTGQAETNCSQIYQSSTDAGVTWSDPQLMFDDLLGCADSNEFVDALVNDPEAPLYILTNTKSTVFLTAWDGLQWSQPEEQSTLAGFEEPEIYTEVNLGCLQAASFGERLFVVGCDEGEGHDLWATSRVLGSNAPSFQAQLWSALAPIADDNLRIEAVELVATEDGLFHTFISQKQDAAIYHTNWDGSLWSRTTAVLEIPDGEAGAPAVAVGPEDELFLIAPNNRGTLYFSRAISSAAVTASSWSVPAKIDVTHSGEIGSADIAIDSAGTLYVAYSVPVNDRRGIYLTLSKDQGTSWSEPLQVFDGVAAGFDFVGAPSLLPGANELLHLLWKVQSIRGDGLPQPLSLYYARSEDGGQSFGDVVPVVDEPVAWREILTDGAGNLHLLWQPQNSLRTVWDQVSADNGLAWNYPQGLPDAGSVVAVTRDPAGNLHLVGIGSSAIGHWLWDGGRWQSEVAPNWPLSLHEETLAQMLMAAVNKQGKLMVVLAKPANEGDTGELTLNYSVRTLQEPPEQNATVTAPTQTLVAPTISPSTPTPEILSTPTTTVAIEPTSTNSLSTPSQSDGPLAPFTIALVPVALLLLSVLGLVIWQATRAKDR